MPKFIGYAPDLDPTTEGVVIDCQNLIPSVIGMKSAPSHVSAGVPAFSSPVISAMLVAKLDGTRKTYYGTSGSIYEYIENRLVRPATAVARTRYLINKDTLQVKKRGAGYKNPGAVKISYGNGLWINVPCTLAPAGITGINVTTPLNGSYGVDEIPNVTVDAPPTGGVRAEAYAVMTIAGFMVAVLDGGAGYFEGGRGYPSGPIQAIVSGGGGTGAKFRVAAQFGRVYDVTCTEPGVDYTSAPDIEIVGLGAGAKVIAIASAQRAVGRVVVTNSGSGYVRTPSVTIDPPVLGGGRPGVIANYSSYVDTIPATASYVLDSKPTSFEYIGDGIGSGAEIDGACGYVSAITLIDAGYGYKAAPTITFTGQTAGVSASAKATVKLMSDGYGSVEFVSLLSAGTMYRDDVAVSISPPDYPFIFYVGRTSGYTTSNSWSFTQFGEATIAANGVDPIQQRVGGDTFADIPGAPSAKIVESVAGFVFAFDTIDPVYGARHDGWWCSSLYDQSNWAPSQAAQAANGRIVDTPGKISAGRALGPDIVVYKDNSMFFGTYQGPPMIWAFRCVSTNIGAPCQEAVVSIGTAHIFMGNDNFYVFDGTRPTPIGDSVRKWWLNDRDVKYKRRVASSHDHANGIVYFHYASRSGGGVIDRCLVFNYKTNQWGRADYPIECAVGFSDGALTWNSLGAVAKTWQDLPKVSYDSDYWTEMDVKPAVVDTNHTVQLVIGESKNSSLTTGDFGDDEQYTTLQQVRLRASSEPSSATMTAEHRTTLGANPNTNTATEYIDGKFDVDVSDRWHRCIFNFSGNVELIGYTPKLVPDGLA